RKLRARGPRHISCSQVCALTPLGAAACPNGTVRRCRRPSAVRYDARRAGTRRTGGEESMLNARTAWLAGTVVIAALAAGCDEEPRSRIVDGCAAPDGTTPLVFTSAQRQLFGFIDPPATDPPYPAVLLLHDAGRTDITRGSGDF